MQLFYQLVQFIDGLLHDALDILDPLYCAFAFVIFLSEILAIDYTRASHWLTITDAFVVVVAVRVVRRLYLVSIVITIETVLVEPTAINALNQFLFLTGSRVVLMGLNIVL